MDEKRQDPSMVKVRSLFEKSDLSLHELGVRMGYEEGIARQSAFQFMKAADPRISMLRRFAQAMKMPIEELVSSKRK
jgi:transcriptional regulator with XRE-family HTH domain